LETGFEFGDERVELPCGVEQGLVTAGLLLK
jgi:hypothetical protein